ncbi:translation elongation factor [Gottfriedia acidiceleris]|uniref:type II restriction enzyme n=1 Tax=Gottfriedia acidiceleris TaxID=371036 RepID=UPI002FFE1A65
MTSTKKSKVSKKNSKDLKMETAWETLFEKYNILSNVTREGYYEIPADDIREYREPRLMCKFDHENNLPEIFKDNKLSILPLSRSKYVIGQFEIFEKVKYEKKKPILVSIPKHIETIDTNNLYSESAALHTAYVSGMIHHLMNEDYVKDLSNVFPSVSGRMGSGQFSFQVKSPQETYKNIDINGSQIEIDGGYESRRNFAIIEAKKESVTDFNVRQLFYPYRVWQNKIRKEVNPIFFTFSQDVFSFFIYNFTDENVFNSIQLIEQIDFQVSHDKITVKDLKELHAKTKIFPEPEIPFPQADTFDKFSDMLGLLVEENLSKNFITENYNFDKRQAEYYTNVGRYLGLIEKYKDENNDTSYSLTKLGRTVMSFSYKQKYLTIAQQILQHEIFNRVFEEFFMKEDLNKIRIAQIMRECGVYNVDPEKNTIERRATTVRAIVKWIYSLVEEYK